VAPLVACLERAHTKSDSRQRNDRNWSTEQPNIRCHIFRCSVPRWFSMQPRGFPMMKSPTAWIPVAKSLANGVSVFSKSDWPAWRNALDRAAPGLFPPELIVQVKALACELPATHHGPALPLESGRTDPTCLPERTGRSVEQFNTLAMAPPRRDSSLATPLLDFSARSRFRSQSRSDPRFVSASVAGTGITSRRVRALDRREDQRPSPLSPA